VAESCTICSSRSRRPIRKLLGIPSYRKEELLLLALSCGAPWSGLSGQYI